MKLEASPEVWPQARKGLGKYQFYTRELWRVLSTLFSVRQEKQPVYKAGRIDRRVLGCCVGAASVVVGGKASHLFVFGGRKGKKDWTFNENRKNRATFFPRSRVLQKYAAERRERPSRSYKMLHIKHQYFFHPRFQHIEKLGLKRVIYYLRLLVLLFFFLPSFYLLSGIKMLLPLPE